MIFVNISVYFQTDRRKPRNSRRSHKVSRLWTANDKNDRRNRKQNQAITSSVYLTDCSVVICELILGNR